jgi:hypothetical protein
MAVQNVPPRSAVSELAALLDSPEITRLIRTIEYVRWTGRPGYAVRSMVGMCLVKSLYALPTWSRTVRLVAEHPTLQAILGCTPSQWACYRFAKQMRERDGWALSQCVNDVLDSLREQHPEMGESIAIDASDLPAYANGHKDEDGNANFSDPDASWGHRSAVSTHAKGGFYGFKIDAAVDVATGLPVAWDVRTAKHAEQNFAVALIDAAKGRGFDVRNAIMDKGYDSGVIYAKCHHRDVVPIIPLKDTYSVKRGAAEPPHCAHGEWTFAGADYKRKATKWRCPTGECAAKSMWLKASRLHPLVPRESKRFKDLYRSRARVEGEFGNLKHEWSLLPLRVRGIERVRLHADLTILTKLASRLAGERATTLAAAA